MTHGNVNTVNRRDRVNIKKKILSYKKRANSFALKQSGI